MAVMIQPSFGNPVARAHWRKTLDQAVDFEDPRHRVALEPQQRQRLLELHPGGEARFWGAQKNQDGKMDPLAKVTSCSDLVWFLAGTGARISEGMAVLWSDVDLDAGTVFIRGTKTAASRRLLSLPPWLRDRLLLRAEHGVHGLVFPSPGIGDRTKIRDKRNVSRVFREVFDEAGFPWATSHTLRRTVATLLGEAGLPLVAAADQLGHKNPSMTAQIYLGRKGDLTAAGAVL